MSLLLALYSVSLIYLSILLPIPQCPDFCSFIVGLKIWQCDPSSLFFFSIVLVILRLFPFYKTLKQFDSIHKIIC